MIGHVLSKSERDDILRRRREALLQFEACAARGDESATAQPGTTDDAEALLRRVEVCEQEYERRLPRLPLSCCPFDGKPLYRAFDPHGFDGLWWRPDAAPSEPPSCSHFCMLRGAVNLNGQAANGGDFTVRIGPEVPYVIPPVLELPGMIAVLSALEMARDCTAYLIAYFAPQRPPVQHLAANWPRELFAYVTGAGERRWRVDRVECDFDLSPWLVRGKIRWCEPGSGNSRLSEAAPDRCPYVDLPGRREYLEIKGGIARTIAAPEGAQTNTGHVGVSK